MAKAKQVVSDMSSAEFDLLRRQFNNLLVVLENVAASVHAGTITADEAFTALNSALSTGADSDIENIDSGSNDYVGSRKELLGVKPGPTHPKRPSTGAVVDMDENSDF